MAATTLKIGGLKTRAETAYLDYQAMGVGRSLLKLCDQYRFSSGGVPTKQLQTLKNWSAKFGWREKVEAWDREQAAVIEAEARERLLQARRDLIDSEQDASALLLERARQMLGFPLVSTTVTGKTEAYDADGKKVEIPTTTIVEPTTWRIRDAARLLEVASRLGRLATELPTEAIRHSGKITVREVIAEIPSAVIGELGEDEEMAEEGEDE